MHYLAKAFLLIISMAMMCHAQVAESLQDLLAKLEDESFKVREQATLDLVAYDISIKELGRLIKVTKGPESKSRLRTVITAKIEATGWVKMANDEVPKRAKPSGHEIDGRKQFLYLVKTTHDGGDYIGKYRTDGLAHFPVGEKEQIINDFHVWVGKGKWQAWEKGCKNMVPMGKTKDGKWIYAARGKMKNGLHLGMLIEAESKARISWGGSVTKLEKFEVLVME